MTLDEITLPPTLPLSRAAAVVEACALAENLKVTQRGTHAEHPGSIHWHFKRGTERGTLEITLLNRERRIILSVRPNRAGEWTESTLERLSEAISSQAGIQTAE